MRKYAFMNARYGGRKFVTACQDRPKQAARASLNKQNRACYK
jgi:hypothetical protein